MTNSLEENEMWQLYVRVARKVEIVTYFFASLYITIIGWFIVYSMIVDDWSILDSWQMFVPIFALGIMCAFCAPMIYMENKLWGS